MAENGLRVIAVGYSYIDELPDFIENTSIEIIGLIGFLDPPKEGVKEAVQTARKAGIRVIMVTGDNIKTAVAVAKMVDIYQEGDFSIKGEDLEKYSDEELFELLKRTSVVARATPENKYRIVKVLQQNKQTVAVTGDGVNDVPALKVADLGIAMGSGSEAAKEVAKMIITDNNLKVIVDAIKYGRNIALNLRKTIYYLMSCSLGEIGLISSAFLLNFPLPLHPIQILWINVVTEGVQDKTFAFNREDKDVMKEENLIKTQRK
jgi:Ca2+-transporting ATPase